MITASVVLYNTSVSILQELIQSYRPNVNRKLYVIDNSLVSLVGCNEMENENIKYYFNGKNLGYGAAHNIGIQQAIADNSEYHLIVNPDVVFESSVIDSLQDYADKHKDVVYMLPKVVYPDGTIQYLCKLLPTPFDLMIRRFIPNTKFTEHWNDKYILKSFGYDKIINPPCLSGCFMFLRTSALKENGIWFDEKFFMYFEDFDLMRRLHRIGKTIFYPEVQIIHKHERSSYKDLKMLMVHMRSACIYFNKYGWFWDAERKRMNRQILSELTEKADANKTMTRPEAQVWK